MAEPISDSSSTVKKVVSRRLPRELRGVEIKSCIRSGELLFGEAPISRLIKSRLDASRWLDVFCKLSGMELITVAAATEVN